MSDDHLPHTRKLTVDGMSCCPCLHVSIWCLFMTSLFFWQSIRNAVEDTLLSARYQQLKNFQFSAHSVLVKIEYISLPLYHVQNLWFTVCWNSSCYIQNASLGSGDRTQPWVHLPLQAFAAVPFLYIYLERFCFNLLFLFYSQGFFFICLFVKSNIFSSYILWDTIWLCFKMFPQLLHPATNSMLWKKKKKNKNKTKQNKP